MLRGKFLRLSAVSGIDTVVPSTSLISRPRHFQCSAWRALKRSATARLKRCTSPSGKRLRALQYGPVFKLHAAALRPTSWLALRATASWQL
jgi:hypothetical protein